MTPREEVLELLDGAIARAFGVDRDELEIECSHDDEEDTLECSDH